MESQQDRLVPDMFIVCDKMIIQPINLVVLERNGNDGSRPTIDLHVSPLNTAMAGSMVFHVTKT